MSATLLLLLLAVGDGGPDDVTTWMDRARAALDARDYGTAAELARQAANARPDSSEAWKVLGLAQFRGGHAAQALEAFNRSLSLQPASAVLQFNRASALFELARYREAQEGYQAAARGDPKVAGLALYDAGLAAEKSDRLDDAISLLEQARGSGPLAKQAGDKIALLKERRVREGYDRIRASARQAKEALHAGRLDEAREDYLSALRESLAIHAAPEDEAELDFGLGYVELRAERYDLAQTDFELAIRSVPGDPAFHFMLGLAAYRAVLDPKAQRELERALALGLAPDEAERARTLLDVLWERRQESAWLTADAHVGAGYDTNVPQSGEIIGLSTRGVSNDVAAPFLAADLDILFRPVGNSRNGAFLEYRFNQLAYLSPPAALDPYSLQEHDLALDGSLSPWPWLTLDADVAGFLMFAGVQTFAPFQDGVSVGSKATVREPEGLQTVVRYVHTWKQAFDPNYLYLSGVRNDVEVSQQWRWDWGRLTIDYQYRRERVGEEQAPLSEIAFPCENRTTPCNVPPMATYFIPYSYDSNQIGATGVAYLPWSLRAMLGFWYANRPYSEDSFVLSPAGKEVYDRPRTDNWYTTEASLSRAFGRYFSLELSYSLLVSQSNIDNTNPKTPFDFDDKNFVKQVIELSFGGAF